MSTRIGLFGQPSAGKSTTAAQVFAECKRTGIKAELIQEYARQLINSGWTPKSLADQLHICDTQRRYEDIVPPEIDVVITDSPVPISYIYSLKMFSDDGSDDVILSHLYANFIRDIRRYDTLYYIVRTKPYVSDGTRSQTEDEADAIGIELRSLLDLHGVKYTVCTSDDASGVIMKDVLGRVKNE